MAVIIQALTNKMRHTSFYDIKEGKLIHYLSSGAGKNARCVSIETEYRYPPKLTEQEQLELESKLMEQSWPGH